MSPNPAKDIMVFLFPSNREIKFLISFSASVINIALEDSGRFNPSIIPAAIATIFLTAPHISVPIISLLKRSFIKLFFNTVSIISLLL